MVTGLTGFKCYPGGTNFYSAYSLDEAALS